MPRTILIVDDLLANRKILKCMLASEYSILEAAGGEEALALLQTRYETISAVLLDIGMPGIDGFEVLRRIRTDAALSQMPVIMITGSDDEASRIKALSLGANDYAMKPYSAEIIKHCLHNNIALRETAATVNILEKDRLTGVWNREVFFRRAAAEIADKPNGYFILGCTDIEGFKVINDQYGSDAGDRILKAIGEALQHSCDVHGGLCGRVFADQFVSLFPRSLLEAERISPEPLETAVFEKTGFRVTLSVGRYIVEDKTLGMNAMFDRAAIAKSTVKGRYDTHVAVYNERMRDRIVREQSIINEMNGALSGGQFEVWFQPQYNYATDAMIGAEALVRWRHPQKGMIPPGDFIHIFEQNGFIYALDRFVWETACRQLRKWMDEGRSPLPVSVNISRCDMLHPDLEEVLCGLIARYGLPMELLRLEVTESAFSESTQYIVDVVKALLKRGFTVEIDDFGSGYSSLNTLKDVPAQILKLDMKFLESSADSQRGGNIVESVVRMAKWLGMSVIAEGVETLEQANYLRSIGCNYMQGYLFARPMPLAQYEAHCRESRKEERLLSLETVANLDNNAFWDPNSMDALIFNSYIGGACIYEYHNGTIELLRATEKYAQVIGSAGMTVEDALKLNWSEHLDAENLSRVVCALEESIATKNEVTGEYVFLDLPNCPHETYLRSTMRVIAAAGERYLVYCTNENVTAQHEAEAKMKTAADQLQSMMDDMPGGFVRLHVAENGRISPVYSNASLCKLVGMSHDALMRVCAADVLAGVHPDDRAMARALIEGMTEEGAAHSARCRMMRGDGSYIWLSILGRATKDASGGVFLNLYYSDATEQLREEETQRALMDNLPCGAGVYEFSAGEMRLTYQNKSYWALVGLYEEAYPDSAPMSAVHPDDIPLIMRELASAVEEQRDVACDIRLRHLTLGYRPVHLRGRIVPKDAGGFLIYATFTPYERDDTLNPHTLSLLLSAIMEASNDFAFAKDRDFRYLCCSPAFLALAGLESERDAVGKTDYELFPVDMAEQFRENDIALLESGRPLVDFDETVRAQDGALHYCLASKHILRDASGTSIGIYGVSRDITKARSALEQLRLVNDSIPGGIATYSYQAGALRIAYCNDGFCKLFGGDRAGLEKRGDLEPIDWVYAEDRPELLRQVEALVRNDTPIDCVFRVHVLGGGCKWVNERAAVAERHGDTVLFNAILLDITERQTALENLRISEEENHLATRLGGNVIGRFSLAERTIRLQPEAAQLHGLPETIGGVPYEPVRLGMIAPESAKVYIAFFEAILNGNKAAGATFQHKYLGDWRWMEVKSSTIFSDEGRPVKAILSFADVTEQVERETIYKKWQQSLRDKRPEAYTLYRCNISKNSSFDTTEGSLLTVQFEEGNFDFDDRTAAYATQYVHEEDRDRFFAFLNVDTLLADFYQGNRVLTIEYRETTTPDAFRWLRLTVDLVESSYTSNVDAYLLFEDIDAAKRLELQMKALSETDPLTGIRNRASFTAKVNRLLRAAKPGTRYALLMLDLDGFKQVNDVFGHAAGDQALIDAANDLRAAMRRDDLVARLGGDEFVVLLSNIANRQAAASKAKQLCALLRKSFSLEVQLSASIGIAVSPLDGMDFDALYRKADAALYYVKGSGKDSFAFYNDNMADEHLAPEPDTDLQYAGKKTEKKRRMLIVDDSVIDHALLQNLFRDAFIIEKAKDGNTALIRLRHYGSAISVVLLDLMMPGMDGFAVLAKMQESSELRSIPVIIVSGDDRRETCLEAIRRGATDFITKPVDTELLRIRVHSAVSKAENERLRAKNSLLELLNDERIRYDAALENTGVTFVELNWRTGEFTYHPSVSKYLCGTFDQRPLWQILLSDMVADTKTVQTMQQLVHRVAEDPTRQAAAMKARFKTPGQAVHSFRITVRKLTGEHHYTGRLMITLDDLEYEDKADA